MFLLTCLCLFHFVPTGNSPTFKSARLSSRVCACYCMPTLIRCHALPKLTICKQGWGEFEGSAENKETNKSLNCTGKVEVLCLPNFIDAYLVELYLYIPALNLDEAWVCIGNMWKHIAFNESIWSFTNTDLNFCYYVHARLFSYLFITYVSSHWNAAYEVSWFWFRNLSFKQVDYAPKTPLRYFQAVLGSRSQAECDTFF